MCVWSFFFALSGYVWLLLLANSGRDGGFMREETGRAGARMARRWGLRGRLRRSRHLQIKAIAEALEPRVLLSGLTGTGTSIQDDRRGASGRGGH